MIAFIVKIHIPYCLGYDAEASFSLTLSANLLLDHHLIRN